MKARIDKTNLSEVNRGLCRSRNNARYTGRTIVWRVTITTRVGEVLAAYASNKKWAAEDFAFWVNKGAWDGMGDAEMKFLSHDDSNRYKMDDNANLFQCDDPEPVVDEYEFDSIHGRNVNK